MSVAVDIKQLAINTIRTLSMDAVQAANSGHPGTPMALAPVTYSLWTDFLKYDPKHPNWMARDRFVLSCGHASMLLYSMLHLTSVETAADDPFDSTGEIAIKLDDVKNFRKLHSPCAGHPEYGYAAGIETTTGPLGQGLGNSVGMAAAAKWMSARFDRDGYDLFEHDVYTLCSDGDVMEGIGCEAASLAGHMKLSNLCWIYDDNKITIEGRTDLAFSEDVKKRFESLGWNVVTVFDANDLDAMKAAYTSFKTTDDRPTLIIVRSVIGFGAPNKQDTASAHGSPLGDNEIKLAKDSYGWPFESFYVPSEVVTHFSENFGKRGSENYAAWESKFAEYRKSFPQESEQIAHIMAGTLPAGWEKSLPIFDADEKGAATRNSSGDVLNAVANQIPWMLGGSADLAGSNCSLINDDSAGHFSAENHGGRNFHFGIREHAMASMCNGMALSGLRPYCATFFVFTDYLRPAMRLSSLMNLNVLYIMTHDSIGLGEDGPTHQPVEHLAACRAIPNLLVMRPADANEVSAAYRVATAQTDRPTCLVLTRQKVPTYAAANSESADCGAYIARDCDGTPSVILIGTGSELSLCMEAHETLTHFGIAARVVSMPCWKLFDEQTEEYRNTVLPPDVTNRVACEAGIKQGWEKYLGNTGAFVGMDSFGASAPASELFKHFGITVDAIVEAAKSQVN